MPILRKPVKPPHLRYARVNTTRETFTKRRKVFYNIPEETDPFDELKGKLNIFKK